MISYALYDKDDATKPQITSQLKYWGPRIISKKNVNDVNIDKHLLELM